MSATPPVSAPDGSGFGASAAWTGSAAPRPASRVSRQSAVAAIWRRYLLMIVLLLHARPSGRTWECASREIDVELDGIGVLTARGLPCVDVVAEDDAHVLGEGPGDAEVERSQHVLAALVVHA